VKKQTIYLVALSSAFLVPGWSGEPPLPGEDGPRAVTEDFKPLLQPGDELPPGSEAPKLPEGPAVLPPELFPEGMPAGSDGVDGLPAPDAPDAPAGGPPGGPGAALPLLPPPAIPGSVEGMEMAARAFWHKSPREAREVSKQERKPLLLFFYQKWKSAPAGAVGAVGGDNNIAINDDLLATPEFNEFASARVVLTRLFYPMGSQAKDYSEAKKAALQTFREYFKVKTLPTILLLDENGREIARESGYSRIKSQRGGTAMSSAEPIFNRLKRAVELREQAIAAYDEKLNRLLAQNYRQWTSRAGTKLLAKLVSASAEEVILRDDSGALRRVAPQQLCLVDQAWIHRQEKSSQQAAAGP